MTLPISAGGLGIRPIHRIRHVAYFASLLQMLPDFLRMYPELGLQAAPHGGHGTSDAAGDNAPPAAYQQTELYAELQMCREYLLQAGAGNRRMRRQGRQLTLEQCFRGAAAATHTSTKTPWAVRAAEGASATVTAAASTSSPLALTTTAASADAGVALVAAKPARPLSPLCTRALTRPGMQPRSTLDSPSSSSLSCSHSSCNIS